VEDIARVLTASISRPRPGRIYNVCDDEPATQADVIEFACGLLGLEPGPEVPFDQARKTMSPMALTFWNDRRLIDNSRLKAELGVRFRYPTYREGLRALHERSA
jgi:nucleoside-diphosphate-sugar epimerase